MGRVALLVALAVVASGCSSTRSDRTAGPDEPAPSPAPSLSPSPPLEVEERVRWASGNTGAVSGDKLLKAWLRPEDERRPRYLVVTTNPFGQRLVFLIRKVAVNTDGEKWFEVLLPERPNGLSGWVRASDVRVVDLEQRIEVDLSERRLRHFVDGRVAHEFSVGVGTEANPTPTGRFYVWSWDRIKPPTGVYGAFAFGISGFAANLSDWAGGGRAAIHGTTNPGDRGQAVSHGCVRVYNDDIVQLSKIEVGTPVLIRR
jgi:hypothetical protein